MANTHINRLRCVVTNTPGTSGNFVVGAAPAGRRGFGAAEDGKTFELTISEGNAWEVRTGCVYTHSTTTVTRGTLADSSTGSAINFTAAAVVSLGVTAKQMADLEPARTLTASAAKSVLRTNNVSANPQWVETFVGFFKVGYGTPSGLTSYPDGTPDAGYLITGFAVSGGAGQTTIVLDSGTVADIAGIWAGVILYGDGIYRAHTIRNASGATLEVNPPLYASVYKAPLYNLFDGALGQHLTEPGSWAYADYIIDYPAFQASRSSCLDAWLETSTSGWNNYGGLTDPRRAFNASGNINFFDAATKSTQFVMRKNKFLNVNPNGANSGMDRTVTLSTPSSGYTDGYIGCLSAVRPVLCEVFIDGVQRYRDLIYGMRRICVPFSNATTINWRYTQAALDNAGFAIGGHYIWSEPTDGYPTKVIPDGSRVVMLGDSWSRRKSDAVVRRINDRLSSKGVTAVSVGSNGQQASWGVTNFSLASACNPTVLLIEFAINDYNASVAFATYEENMRSIAASAAAIGAQPIILMPPGTASFGQAQGLGTWSADMGA